jgi:hypothetical protein
MGHNPAYPSGAARAASAPTAPAPERVLQLVEEATPPQQLEDAATSESRVAERGRLVPELRKWVPRLVKGGAVGGAVLSYVSALYAGTQAGQWLYTEFGTDVNTAGGTGFGILSFSQNSSSGAKLSSGFAAPTKCDMERRRTAPIQYGLGNFLVIPVGVAPVVSVGLCNGPNPPA